MTILLEGPATLVTNREPAASPPPEAVDAGSVWARFRREQACREASGTGPWRWRDEEGL